MVVGSAGGRQGAGMLEVSTMGPSRVRSRCPEAGVVSGARIFLEASLEHIEAREIATGPEMRVATWLYSLGAVDALAKLAHLDRVEFLDAAIQFFSADCGVDEVTAAILVGSLQEMCEEGVWSGVRDDGEKAMADWLSMADDRALARLRGLLDTTPWPEAGAEAAATLAALGTPAH